MIKAKLYKEQLKPNVTLLLNHIKPERNNDKDNCLFCHGLLNLMNTT